MGKKNAPKQSTVFYVRLYKLCDERGLTPERLVRDLGWAWCLSDLFAKGKIPYRNIAELAEYFDVKYEYFTKKDELPLTYDTENIRAFFADIGRVGEQIGKSLQYLAERYVVRSGMIVAALKHAIKRGPIAEILYVVKVADALLAPLLCILAEAVKADGQNVGDLTKLTKSERKLLLAYRDTTPENKKKLLDYTRVIRNKRARLKRQSGAGG